MGEFPLIPENLIFSFSEGRLESGRHPRGFPEPVGSILVEYEPERTHMDLVRTILYDFRLMLQTLRLLRRLSNP